MFVAEEPVFPRQDNDSHDVFVHILIEAIQFFPLVDAFLSADTCTFVVQAYIRLVLAVEQLA
jgi:hypothetical protein